VDWRGDADWDELGRQPSACVTVHWPTGSPFTRVRWTDSPPSRSVFACMGSPSFIALLSPACHTAFFPACSATLALPAPASASGAPSPFGFPSIPPAASFACPAGLPPAAPTSSPFSFATEPTATSRYFPPPPSTLNRVVRPRPVAAQADHVPGMVRGALVGVGRDAFGRDFPARGLERLVSRGRTGSDGCP